jgi:hypothetical protein
LVVVAAKAASPPVVMARPAAGLAALLAAKVAFRLAVKARQVVASAHAGKAQAVRRVAAPAGRAAPVVPRHVAAPVARRDVVQVAAIAARAGNSDDVSRWQ